jgi:hypothetical protein
LWSIANFLFREKTVEFQQNGLQSHSQKLAYKIKMSNTNIYPKKKNYVVRPQYIFNKSNFSVTAMYDNTIDIQKL